MVRAPGAGCYHSPMSLFIPDDILKEAGLTADEALTEFACRLFDAGRLSKSAAAKLSSPRSGRDSSRACPRIAESMPLPEASPRKLQRRQN